LTKRSAHWAALAGAAVFALTPVATLMFRFNNPDALLVFAMVVAGYLTVRATEHAGRGWLALAGVAIGLGFLTKMLQAFLVLPALAVAYWFAAPASWKRKIVDLLVAFAAMCVSFGWYLAAVELTPASQRPYIGGSQSNSIVELILSYNGLGRITGSETGSVGGGNGWGETGILRMFSGVSGGMVSWLIPAALVLGVGAILVAIRSRVTSAASVRPVPLTASAKGQGLQSPSQALLGAAIIWLGWLVVTALVFSFMAGIYHDYYTVALAPGIGGAVAIGGAALWANRGRAWARITLGATSLGTGVWALALLMQAGSWYTYLGWAAFGVGAVAGLAMIWVDQLPKAVASSVLVAALGAGLAGPLAYSIQTAATAHTGSIPTAGPVTSFGGGRGGGPGAGGPGGGGGFGRQAPGQTGTAQGNPPQGGMGGGTGADGMGGGMGGLINGATASSELVAALQADGGSYTWAAATTGSQNAASYQLASGYSVMAIGGFNGSDPSPTLEQFKAYVAAGRIHYYIGGSVGNSAGGSSDASEIASWVSENFTATTVGGTTVYDLTQAS
jgi:4-amino-4-deoxy-L-arabinose transferase-like glycosyltransferase